jgi:hypothetical protein
MLSLELNTKDYAEALLTWEHVRGLPLDESQRANLQKVIEDVELLRTDDRSYTVPGEMGEQTSWFYRLLKKRFYVTVAEGELAEVKLRCDNGYVFFRYEREKQYNIAGRDGFCTLELVGNPGTKFSLVQL